MEEGLVTLVDQVAGSVDVPVAVKMSPYWSALSNLATRLERTGAAGLVLFNRFYQPDIDIETREVVPRLVLSSASSGRSPAWTPDTSSWVRGVVTSALTCSSRQADRQPDPTCRAHRIAR